MAEDFKEPDYDQLWDDGMKRVTQLASRDFTPKYRINEVYTLKSENQPTYYDPHSFAVVQRKDKMFLLLEDHQPMGCTKALELSETGPQTVVVTTWVLDLCEKLC